MAQVFKYIALDSKGRRVKGEREAASRDEVANYLHEQNMVVVSVQESLGLSFDKIASIQIGGVPLKDRVVFVKQLSTMLGAGLPIIQALDILVTQTTNQSLKEKLQRVYQEVSSGISLSDAFRKEETIFSKVQLNLLVAGEKSGNLNEMMEKIAVDMEQSKNLRSKIRGAMIYPALLILVLVAVVAVMMVFMIPSVQDLYQEFGQAELPFITQILVDASNFFTSIPGILTVVGTVSFGFFGFRYWYASPKGRRQVDRLILQLPVFGELIQKMQLAEFNRLLSLLLISGVSIVDALQIVGNALSNTAFSDLLQDAALQVSKGNSITLPLSKKDVFPPMMIKMLATGEETGNIDKVTADMGAYYDKEVDEITSNLTKLMEPLIMILVGGVVAFLAIAIYLPIYQLGQFAA